MENGNNKKHYPHSFSSSCSSVSSSIGSGLYRLILFGCVTVSRIINWVCRIASSSPFLLGSQRRRRRRNSLLSLSSSNGKSQCKLPRHIAFLINDKRYVNLGVAKSLIRHSNEANIGCITLCDPWTKLKNGAADLIEESNGLLQHPNLPIKVCWLGANDGEVELVRACKKLSQSKEVVTVEKISQFIAQSNHGEPDFLVCLGPEFIAHLAGYSSWVLRTTELHSVAGFTRTDSVDEHEFVELINEYARRCRRFGC